MRRRTRSAERRCILSLTPTGAILSVEGHRQAVDQQVVCVRGVTSEKVNGSHRRRDR